MSSLSETLALLREHARPSELAGMARFGMDVQRRLGVSVPELRRIAKTLGRDHALAQALWECGIPDAQILAAHIAEPQHFTSRQMDSWVKDMHSWDVCDQACSNAFARSPLGWRKVHAWSGRREEFVRRAAFALLAALVVHDKAATDAQFIAADLARRERAAGAAAPIEPVAPTTIALKSTRSLPLGGSSSRMRNSASCAAHSAAEAL